MDRIFRISYRSRLIAAEVISSGLQFMKRIPHFTDGLDELGVRSLFALDAKLRSLRDRHHGLDADGKRHEHGGGASRDKFVS